MFKSIVAPTILVSLLWILISIFSTFTLNSLIQSNDRSLADDVTTIESAWAMRRDVWRMQTAILDTARLDTAQARGEVAALEKDFQKSLADARATSFTAPEKAAVGRIEARFADYSGQIHGALDQASAGPQELPDSRRAAFAAQATSLADGCRELSEINEGLINQATARNDRLYNTVSWVRFCSIIIGPGAGVLLGLWLARRLRRSVSRISAKLTSAGGALAGEGAITSGGAGELPDLSRQADLIATRVRSVVDELERTRRQVIQSERLAAVGELAAGVAHEIRNPLTSVKLLIQNVAQVKPGRVLNERETEVLLQEISRMETLVEDLLNFARPPRLRVVAHDVRLTLRRAMTLVGGRARQRGIAVVEDVPQSEVILTGDPEQLLLVFLNLAINGLEATERGRLTVSLRALDASCGIVFSDSGPGIAPEIMGRLFEPFVTMKERGTGLGLAICRRIVHEHGGKIWAENLPGGGARFSVEIPLASAPQAAAPAQVPSLPDCLPAKAILVSE